MDSRMAFSRAIWPTVRTTAGVTLQQAAFAAVSRRSAADSTANRTRREAHMANEKGETSLRERLRWKSKHIPY
jgi:hypothetical protein